MGQLKDRYQRLRTPGVITERQNVARLLRERGFERGVLGDGHLDLPGTGRDGPRFDYVPTPTGARVHDSDAQLRVVIGPYGCGKSFMSWRDNFARVANMESVGGRIDAKTLAMRNTVSQTIDTMFPMMLEALPWNWDCTWIAGQRVANISYRILRGGEYIDVNHEVIFRAVERVEDERKIKSLNVTNFIASEFSELNVDVLMTAFGRTGRYPSASRRMHGMMMDGIMESNNFYRSHPAYDKLIRREGVVALANKLEVDPDTFLELFRYPSGWSKDAENLDNLPDNYYEMLEATHDKKWADVFIGNEFGLVARGRQCYHFDRKVHTDVNWERPIEAHPDFPLHLGVDLGRDSAYVLTQEMPNLSVRVVDSFRVRDRALTDAAKDAANYFARRYPNTKWKWKGVWVDPGGKARWQNDDIRPLDYIVREFARFRCRIDVCRTNDPNTRVEAVNDLLTSLAPDGKPRLAISNDDCCIGVVDACSGYHWEEIKEHNMGGIPQYRDRPEKDYNSHMAEALQYAVMRDQSRKMLQGIRGRDTGGRSLLETDIPLLED